DYAGKAEGCVDCDMPLVESADYGNTEGKLHSHRFPAANTALPLAYQDAAQMATVTKFLQDKIITVDIFAISPETRKAVAAASVPAELSTTFAVVAQAASYTHEPSA